MKDPHIQQGLDYDLYKIEKCHEEMKQKVSHEKLQVALDAFSIVERKNLNAPLHHDRGFIYLLMRDEEKALVDFKQGLKLDPCHPLLRYERGCLLLWRGKTSAALEDLNQGRMMSVDSPSLTKKYDVAIQKAMIQFREEQLATSRSPEDSKEPVAVSRL